MWQTLAQQGKGSWGFNVFFSQHLLYYIIFCSLMLFLFHPLLSQSFTLDIYFSIASFIEVLLPLLPFSLWYPLPLWCSFYLPNTFHISLPSLHLALSFVLSPQCSHSNLSPPPRWLSSWFLRLYHFVCQVGTGDAAGCTLTSLCHFHSNSHQVCLRRCLFPSGSFQACMSYSTWEQ